MGRMMVIPFGLRMLLESCCDGYRSDGSQPRSTF
jgi:hypothetical protein